MASNRPLKLDNWGISWEEYKELSYFCLQYDRKKREAAALLTIPSTTVAPVTYHVGGKEYGTFLPHGNRTGDPVAVTAERRERLLNDVRMIEQAATAACENEGEGLFSALIKAVTTRCGVQAVYANPDTRPPLGEKQFYSIRRRFFYFLREIRCGSIEAARHGRQ